MLIFFTFISAHTDIRMFLCSMCALGQSEQKSTGKITGPCILLLRIFNDICITSVDQYRTKKNYGRFVMSDLAVSDRSSQKSHIGAT